MVENKAKTLCLILIIISICRATSSLNEKKPLLQVTEKTTIQLDTKPIDIIVMSELHDKGAEIFLQILHKIPQYQKYVNDDECLLFCCCRCCSSLSPSLVCYFFLQQTKSWKYFEFSNWMRMRPEIINPFSEVFKIS